MTDLRQAAQQAIEALEYASTGNRRPEIIGPAITALRKALEQPVQEPVAWAVQGCSKMWRDDFAEIDAKAEAKRIGGTCVAYALYTTPPVANWERTSASFDEWWNGNVMPSANPFVEGTAAYWAWAGWKAAQRPWQGLTDEEVAIASAEFDLKSKMAYRAGMYKAQIILRKKNDPTY